jgi:hypothetical protein
MQENVMKEEMGVRDHREHLKEKRALHRHAEGRT